MLITLTGILVCKPYLFDRRMLATDYARKALQVLPILLVGLPLQLLLMNSEQTTFSIRVRTTNLSEPNTPAMKYQIP